jgi:natural product biosynthesis luciferase-like monooxygenase protein
MSHETFRCCLIGENSLVIECAEVLLRRGHGVVAVVAPPGPIADWAERAGVTHRPPGPGLVEALSAEPFDYLFSAANLSVLPAEVLALPRCGAVNFHDGPLPRYAGLHATSWALIRRERTHGITWHAMTAAVDGGDILKQRQVEIAPGETALSLNTACFQAGIEAFEELVQELEEGRVRRTPQDPEALEYFGRFMRPEAACAISWSRPAEEIDALVRALQFGPYGNPLGLPKLFHRGEVFYPSDVRLLDPASGEPPGTVLASVSGGGLVVSTGTRDLEIAELLDARGRRSAGSELGAAVGERLAEPDPEARQRLTALYGEICRHERYWSERLSRLRDLESPYAEVSSEAVGSPSGATLDLEIPQGLDAAVVPAAFALYLGRLCQADRFHLAYSTDALREAIAGFEGLFATHVPVEVEIDPTSDLASQLEAIQRRFLAADRRMTWSRDLPLREPGLRDAAPLRLGFCVERRRDPEEISAPADGSQLVLVVAEDGSRCRWIFDPRTHPPATIERMQAQFEGFLRGIAADPARTVGECSLLDAGTRRLLLEEWAAPRLDYDRGACIHHLFEERAASCPDRVAAVFEDQQIAYGELNARANQLAAFLRRVGVAPGALVGLFMERSIDLLVGLLGILKAGGAYLPLDPSHPGERIEFMLEDADVSVLVTQSELIGRLPAHRARTVRLDGDWSLIRRESAENADGGASGESLAYAIYTSGSTGRPKGVLVRHRNAVNLFLGIDQHVPHDPPGVFLAVTTLSFDISVLELFWSLTRGFRVVLSGDRGLREPSPAGAAGDGRDIDFSLFYFSSDAQEELAGGRYDLLLKGARFADEHGFSAVWTPERHFHAFGGLYPNPAVTSAAIAAITERVAIRAGSCVLPLHHPLRVAEEWSVVDNLSRGRVGVAFASGWQPNDFVLRPENFAHSKEVMFRDIEVVQKLWRGEAIPLTSPKGEEIATRILPRPVQPELPIWITTAGTPESFRMAGERGFNLLTHLVGQTLEELSEKIAAYREARAAAGHAGSGHVTLMLHSFVGDSAESVREAVRGPMREYLRSAVGLVQKAAWTFPTQKQRLSASPDVSLSEEDMEALLDHAFDRYYESSALFGTPEECVEMVRKVKAIGVDEIGCLIDFGVDSARVLEHLEHLNRLVGLARTMPPDGDFSIPAQIVRHAVTHLQCTPSLARVLLADPRAREALSRLEVFLVGGEALAPALAAELGSCVGGRVFNVYGPTETTIWSTLQELDPERPDVGIGRPLANQRVYVVDAELRLAPLGVAGELLIGGDGVSAGYLGRPELTAERFVPVAFGEEPMQIVYRTGDRVRYRADGTLEFVGRVDHQVKIRGHRIEPGEIEAVLETHPGIAQAVVTAREDGEGERRLVAYTRAPGGRVLSVGELRSHLEGVLPDYMIPSSFVNLEVFPLTPAGKVDRAALPEPASDRPNLEEAFAAPATPAQEEIAELWRGLLGVEEIGIRDDFFELGGDSLLVVHFVSRAREKLGVEIRVGKVFEAPTVEAMAEHVEEIRLVSGCLAVDPGTAGYEREEIQI